MGLTSSVKLNIPDYPERYPNECECRYAFGGLVGWWLALGISHNNGALTQAELASKMQLGSASVGRLVDRLVDRGFVERRQDPEDRRAYRLALRTPSRICLSC